MKKSENVMGCIVDKKDYYNFDDSNTSFAFGDIHIDKTHVILCKKDNIK